MFSIVCYLKNILGGKTMIKLKRNHVLGIMILGFMVMGVLPASTAQGATVDELAIFKDVSLSIKYSYISPASRMLVEKTIDIPTTPIKLSVVNSTLVMASDGIDGAYTDCKMTWINGSAGHTYSPSYGAFFGTETEGARNVYQTLSITSENDYSGHATADDLTYVVYQLLESPATYLDRVMAGISASYTSANATIIYARYITEANKANVDDIFATATEDNSWEDTSTYASDTGKVRGLFEDVFADAGVAGLIYGVAQTSSWATGKTVFDHIDDAMTNTSHPAIPGATKTAHIRNAYFGYTGYAVAEAVDIEGAGSIEAVNPTYDESPFSLIAQTDDAYVISFNVFSDLTTSSKLVAGITTFLTEIFPSDKTLAGATVFPIWVHFLLPLVVILGVMGIVAIVKLAKKKTIKISNPKRIVWALVISYAVMVGIMFLIYGASLSWTV